MKTLDQPKSSMTLAELMKLAGKGTVVIRSARGKQYLFAAVDEAEVEARAFRNSAALMALLDERSKEKATISLDEVRRSVLAGE